MRSRSDHIAKETGVKLFAYGTTTTQQPINSETQYGDLYHVPDLARQSERDRLGLLGRLASTACLLEFFSRAPTASDFRACLSKHLAICQQRARDVRSKRGRNKQVPRAESTSFLWIIAAGSPTKLLTELKLKPSPDWPPGVYLFGGRLLNVGLIVASELPRDRTTLVVRVMAAGPLLAEAVPELAALPTDAYERTVIEPILLRFSHKLEKRRTRTPDEQEFMMAMLKSWSDHKNEGLAKGLAEGQAKGLAEGQAKALLTVLRIRGIAVPDAARERIATQTDLEVLERWLEKAAVASAIDDVLDEP
jgi:hypothetical protein